MQIQREIFFGTLVAKAQTAKNPTDLVQALCQLARQRKAVMRFKTNYYMPKYFKESSKSCHSYISGLQYV